MRGPRELFAAILERIQRFGVPLPLVQRGWVSRKAKNMAISNRRQLLLRHGAGKCPRSTLASGNGSDRAFKHRPLSSAGSFGFEIGPESGGIAALESANGKSQILALPWPHDVL